MIDPERLDLPSASSFDIVVACPGQPNLKRALGELLKKEQEEPDEIALSGTRIHAARETGVTIDLDEDELATYKAGRGYEEALVAGWVGDRELMEWAERKREERMWLHDQSTGRPIISAKLDTHYLSGSYGLVVDWKTGWSWKLTPSQRNWQLRVQAVLVWREYNGIKHIRVAFVKPIAKYERLDFTDYAEDDLKRAEEQIYHHLWLAKQPDAPRHAGPHCNYCPCKSYCREAAAYAMVPSVITTSSGQMMTMQPELSKQNIIALVDTMPLQQVALVHLRASLVVKILEACKARLKLQDDAMLDSLGLMKAQGRRLDPIVKTKECFDFLKEQYQISEDELWRALKFSKTELVDALRRDKGWAKAATDGFIRGQLGEFIQEKRADDSVVSK